MQDLRPYRIPAAGSQPDYLSPAYASTVKRSPSQGLILLPQSLSELTGPVFGHERVLPSDAEDRKSTRLNSSHTDISRMPSSA